MTPATTKTLSTTSVTTGPVVSVQWPAGCGQQRPCAKVFVNEDGNTVQILLRGPAGVWYGVGFDALRMGDQPYAIIVLGDGSVQERQIGNYAAGSELDSTVTKLQEEVSNGLRTVVLQRASAGKDLRYHSFISKESINYIWAYGSQSSFGYHNSDNGSPARGIWATCLPIAECDSSWCDVEKHFLWCAAQVDQCDSNFCVGGDLSFSLPATITSVPDEFMAVDNGSNRACRGASAKDNSGSYYNVFSAASLEECKDNCRGSQDCVGIEFNSNNGRCEVWVRAEGIGATAEVSGYQCLRYNKGPALVQGLHRRLRTQWAARSGTLGTSWLQHGACSARETCIVGDDILEAAFAFDSEL